MRTWSTFLIAAPIAAGLLAAPAAHADWHRGGWHGGYWQHDHGGGNAAASALLGLGIGALIGGAIVASQPQYYAPPPVVYAPPPYYAPPVYGYPSGY